MLDVLRTRPRRKDGEGASSRCPDDGPTPMVDPTPWVAHEPAAPELGVCNGTIGSCFSRDFTAVEEGTLKSQRQGGKQHSISHKDTVLTHQWRCTSSASTARRCRRCRSGSSSSSGAPQSPHRADQSVGHGSQYEVQQEKHLKGQPQGRQAEESHRAPSRSDLPRSQELRPQESRTVSPT